MNNAAIKLEKAEMEIVGVEIKELKSHGDERGFFREIIRVNDTFFKEAKNFAQWSHSRMQCNVVKAWHYHHIQTDWWYIASGQVRTVLIDNRPESPTYKNQITILMGESHDYGKDTREVCVKIPPGVLHGCKVLSSKADLFYITSEIYNPNEEGRIPYNSELIGYDWGNEAIVVENDKRLFTPTSTRALIA